MITQEIMNEIVGQLWYKYNSISADIRHIEVPQRNGMKVLRCIADTQNDCMIRYRLKGRDEKEAFKEALISAAQSMRGAIDPQPIGALPV